MRKAELTLGTIGVAILVLVTLAIVLSIATGQFGKWTKDFEDVKGRFGVQKYCEALPADAPEGSLFMAGHIYYPKDYCTKDAKQKSAGEDFVDVKAKKESQPDAHCCVCKSGAPWPCS